MPHIHAQYIQNPTLDDLLTRNKTALRKIIAAGIGYPEQQVAFIPERIPIEAADVADNMMAVEFVIDAGSRTPQDLLGELARNITERIAQECHGFSGVEFGVWIRPHVPNGFASHAPDDPQE